jgi:hypothetical protein
MVKLIKIVPSHLAEKKYDAHFLTDTGRTKVVPFGARGMDDLTKTKNFDQQKRYIERHSRGGENWSSPMTAGALSRYVLWSATTLRGGIANYKKRFNL